MIQKRNPTMKKMLLITAGVILSAAFLVLVGCGGDDDPGDVDGRHGGPKCLSGRQEQLIGADAHVGHADLGVVGKDTLLEQGKDLYEPLDLKFGYCRLVVAEPKELLQDDDPANW